MPRGGAIGNYSNDSLIAFDESLFHVCWRRQSCSSCLEGDVRCSWCPISSSCVPNPVRLPILSPIGSAHICPLGSEERWELRAQPFGCNASTLTVLSVMVSILGMLVTIGAGCGILYLAKYARRRWEQPTHEPRSDHGQDCSLATLLNKSLTGVFGKSRRRHGQSQILVEEAQDNDETRPLLQ